MSDTTTALRESEPTVVRRSIPRKRRRLTRPILGAIILLAVLIGGYSEWRHLSTYEATAYRRLRDMESRRVRRPGPQPGAPNRAKAAAHMFRIRPS